MDHPPSTSDRKREDRAVRRAERVRLGYFGEARRPPRWRGPIEQAMFLCLAFAIIVATLSA